MLRRGCQRRWAVPLSVTALLLSGVLLAIPYVQQQPRLRSSVVLVPLDVRVLDARGDPVTNLPASDFEVSEDGVVQEIALLTMYDTTQLESQARSHSEVLSAGYGKEPSPGRVFLIVLGRGDLQGPSRGLSALTEFVKTRLLPSDRIAVLAYKRVTDFTTDRTPLLRLLEQYKNAHRLIERRLELWFIGEDIPAKINALFDAPGLPKTRELPHPFNPSDVGQFVLGVNHLRLIDGEKHLIFLSENTLGGRMMSTLARRAADARVAVSMIRTGGSIGQLIQPGPRGGSVSFSSRSFDQLWREQDARDITRETGGHTYLYQYADKALDAIERGSRVRYLLGYYPTNQTRDGTYRRIVVKVKRPGATVLYRRGYFAHAESEAIDPRALITDERIRAAGRAVRPPRDIAIGGSATLRRRPGAELNVHVDLEVQTANVVFRTDGGSRLAELEIATFLGDSKQNLVGELRQRLEVRRDGSMPVGEENHSVAYTADIGTRSEPRYVKVIVYDGLGDRLGVAVFDLSKK
jgi:VWFA-related protein